MSLSHKKQFLFNLANAYFLLGNYADAKARYGQCIEADPNPQLKTRAYNNLALACWWHKNPLLPEQQVQAADHRMDMVDGEFRQTREIFLKALETSENPSSLETEEQRF